MRPKQVGTIDLTRLTSLTSRDREGAGPRENPPLPHGRGSCQNNLCPARGGGHTMKEAAMHPPSGVLLDVDGTLVDSNDAHAQAWVRALAEAGIAVPFEKVRALIGKGGDKLLPEV